MNKDYYVVSTNTAATVEAKIMTVSLSERDPNATEDDFQPFGSAFTITLTDEAEFAAYEVGTKVVVTLKPAAK